MPTIRASLGAIGADNGKVYAIGGCVNSPPCGTAGSFLSTVEIYDPATNLWTTGAPMPEPRVDVGLAKANGKLYAIGGFGASGFQNSVHEYDPATNVWTNCG